MSVQSCKTAPKEVIIIPERPHREEIKVPETLEDMVNVIIYYETLVTEFEAWATVVEEVIYARYN